MRRVALAYGLLLCAAGVAQACPVCMGASDDKMTLAVKMGIFVLLGVTGCILAGLGAFFVYLAHRGRRFNSDATVGKPQTE